MNVFATLGAQSAANRADIGFRPQSRLSGRPADLAHALRPLYSLHPVLSSRYVVKGWLDRGALSVLYGESNVGKTFLALDLAMHVAAGMDWHGHRVPSGERWAGPVIYIAGEGGTGLHNRVEAIRCENPELMEHIGNGGDFLLLPVAVDLCTSEDADHLLQVIKSSMDTMPALIVVDTLARTMGNGDENAAKDMGQFVRSVDRLRVETGAHVMVIHHSGKDASKGARGSGSLRAAADTEIELTRSDGVVIARARKQRDMPCDGAFAYRLKNVFLGFDEDGDAVTSAVVEPAEIEKADKRRRASGRTEAALSALSNALAEGGRIINSPDLPSVPVVEVKTWRTYWARLGLTDSDDPQTKGRTFRRHRDALIAQDLVRVSDDFVWRLDTPRTDKADTQPVAAVRADKADMAVAETRHDVSPNHALRGQLPAYAEHQQMLATDKADRQRTQADMSAPQTDGHGHPL
ncbi:AAA family ATPase [Paracoccus sp. S-4012]|uniref:AAA family ATPase n=1 Tax=Paracoccus sp. S-4012 TaxID=2665648 RepID=UPI0012B06455|nr:helicase RepA family protein [Paracoccus sp. S-4012]MRX50183.1 AAA family ATPase [Paracoccus sp. S-4012]